MTRVDLDRVSRQFPGTSVPAVDRLSLQIGSSELVALLGPSGCGKTTVLRMIAGLEDPDSGDIAIEGRSVVGLEPKDRDVALVFQQYALYPHMTAGQNIAYPLKMENISRQERDLRVRDTADLLEIAPLLNRKPAELSGGEQQRVALGRAIVRRPRVFLMDEPLSNLDALLRLQTRATLKALQRELGVTTVMVTHDQSEAMTMAHRIAVMNAGSLEQIGTPDEVYDTPATAFVASFIGDPPMNLLPAERTASFISLAGIWPFPAPPHLAPGHYRAGLRPEAIRLSLEPVEGACAAQVFVSEPLGSETLVSVRLGADLIRVRVAPSIRPNPNTIVYLTADPSALRLFDAVTGLALPPAIA